MSLSRQLEPITQDDDFIGAALLDADIPSLLPALAHILGDHSLLRPGLAHDPLTAHEPQAGLSAAQLDEAEIWLCTRCGDSATVAAELATGPTDDDLRTLMSFATSGQTSDDYLALLREELGIGGRPPRPASGARRRSPPTGRSASSSSAPACRASSPPTGCTRPASTYVVLEKNADVGGTWLENTLPGLPGRRAEPLLLLLVRAARRLAAALLHPAGAARLLPRRAPTSSACATTSASAPRSLRREFDEDADGVDAARSARPTARRRPSRPTPSSARVGQLNRPNLPDIAGPRRFAGPVVPLGRAGTTTSTSPASASR